MWPKRNAGICPVLRRWLDLFLLWAISMVILMVIRPFLEAVGKRVDSLLVPWGRVGGLFFAITTATATWFILQLLGVNPRAVTRLRFLRTNPPAWPLGVVSFVVLSLFWQGFIGAEHAESLEYSLEVLASVLVFVLGGLLAFLMASFFADRGLSLQANEKGEQDTQGLGELTSGPEGMLKWLEREEPIVKPAEDLFDMTVYARRMASLLSATPFRTIGLVGPYGCGKSSIVNMTRHYLIDGQYHCERDECTGTGHAFSNHAIIVSEVSGWGCHEGTAAQYILDVILRDVSRKLDCLEVANVPTRYQRMMTDSGGIFRTVCALVFRHVRAVDILHALDDALVRSGIRLVVFLEDLDRNIADHAISEIAVLLDGLKGLQNCSFVLAIGEQYRSQEITLKLCEHVEVVAHLPRYATLNLLRSFRRFCLERYPEDIDPLEREEREKRARFEPLYNMDRLSAMEPLLRRPIDSLSALLTTPRMLKACLRRAWIVWQSLHGELDFDDILVCCALRVATPDTFFLINENIEKFRSLSPSPGADSARKRANSNRDLLGAAIREVCERAGSDIETVSALIGFLFTGWEESQLAKATSAQGVGVGEPTDYWARLTREQVVEIEIRDQHIFRAIRTWKEDKNSPVFQGQALPQAILHVDHVADKVEQFGNMLNGKEIRDIADVLFKLICQEENIGDGRDKPGFVQLWRISHTKEFKSHEKWVVGQVRRALGVSLRFANDIYTFWRHGSPHMNSSTPTPEIREDVIRVARDVYEKDPRVYIHAVDRSYPWSTYHLIVLYGSSERGGPGLENEDWQWFAPVLMQAWAMEPEVVLPQIVVLLTTGDAKPDRPNHIVYEYSFSESVAENVFGRQGMAELVDRLSKANEPREYAPEIAARLNRCQGYAQKWKSEHRATEKGDALNSQ